VVGAWTVVVDDHPAFRAGLAALLARDAHIASVREAGSVSEALQLAAQQNFDLAIVDVVLPETGGAALCRQLTTLQPQCKVLALSMLDEPVRIAEIMRAGASGYALKSQPVDEILGAVDMVLGGARYLAARVVDTVTPLIANDEPLPLERLTQRERDVFDLLIRGYGNQLVSDTLAIARRTVEAHRRHIMQKLEARSIVDLIRVAIRHGLIRNP